jgi:GMP synthase (glutamine-hydrolysing)
MGGDAVYVIKAGDTFPDLIEEMGNFEDWIIAGMGLSPGAVQVVNAEKKAPLPDPEIVRGAVISGSHAMVTEKLPWSLALEAWTRQMVEAQIPLLGICYGHQILARAMGGSVGFHSRGTEIGTTSVSCHAPGRKDPLFQALPDTFKVHVFHSQSVLGLPEGAVLLAGNGYDPNQAFRMGPCAWGVQFHPEADARVTRGYIRNLKEALTGEGQDDEALAATIEDTPHAAALLRRFGAMAGNG